MPKTLKETRMEWEEGLEIQDEHTLDGKTNLCLTKNFRRRKLSSS